MSPPFIDITNKVRKDPLGQITLNTMSRNAEQLDELARAEHTFDGEHNTLMVARTGGRLEYSGTYTCIPWNGYPTLETGYNPATGTLIVTLQAGKFSAPALLALTNVVDGEVASKPHLVGMKPAADGSTITFFTKYLDSALGSGNDWLAINKSIDFAIHSYPWNAGPSRLNAVRQFTRYDGYDPGGASDLAENQGLLYDALLNEHNPDGSHGTVLIPRAYVFAKCDGTDFDIDLSENVLSVTKLSTGVAEVTLRTGLADIRAFTSPEWARTAGGTSDDLNITHVRATATDTLEVYNYRFDRTAKTWDFADNDFFLVVHGEP